MKSFSALSSLVVLLVMVACNDGGTKDGPLANTSQSHGTCLTLLYYAASLILVYSDSLGCIFRKWCLVCVGSQWYVYRVNRTITLTQQMRITGAPLLHHDLCLSEQLIMLPCFYNSLCSLVPSRYWTFSFVSSERSQSQHGGQRTSRIRGLQCGCSHTGSATNVLQTRHGTK